MSNHGKGAELMMPVLVDKDTLILHLDAIGCVPLFECMLNKCSHYFLVKGIRNIEHIVAVALSSFWIPVGEVFWHGWELHELVVELFDRQLIILGDLDELDFSQLQQFLVSFQNLFGEFAGEHFVGGHIIL